MSNEHDAQRRHDYDEHIDLRRLRQIIEHRFDEISYVLSTIVERLDRIMGELDALKAAVQKNSDAEDSAIILLKGLKDKLDAAIASGDPAALTALSNTLGSKAEELSAAVVANTPSA